MKNIAIVGAGISGLGAAYLLGQRYDLSIYEANARIGGHSRTIEVDTPATTLAVDTGFIVFNERNYPNLCALFEHLGVPSQDIPMSFGVSVGGGELQYSSTALFAQKSNLLRPSYWRMLLDILRFNKNATRFLQQESSAEYTLGQYLRAHGFGAYFCNYYLRPMVAAIWSCPPGQMDNYPARNLFSFLHNHGLLSVNQQPQWRSVIGGSREYLRALSQGLSCNVNLNCRIKAVIPQTQGVLLIDADNQQYRHDGVVLACHGDQASELLAGHAASAVLANLRCYSNAIVVHSDVSLMPPNKAVWASWNYLQQHQDDQVCLIYWMNNLQNLPGDLPIIVSLNPQRQPRAELVHDRYQFRHPIFDSAAIRAQSQLQQFQGRDRIWYCGAWQGYGFHEDGLTSAIKVAQSLGCEPPWR